MKGIRKGVIIGSTCLQYWFPEFKRKCKDLDIAIEGESFSDVSGDMKIEYLQNPIIATKFAHERFLNKDALYTLKISHVIGWDIFWQKNLNDILFLTEKGCKLDKELFLELYEYWNKVHSKNKRSDLTLTAEQFFDNAVQCEWDHDKAHEVLIGHSYFKGQKEPTYKKVLKDGFEVDVDEDKFNLLSHEEKCNLVREEVYLMAAERWPKDKFWIAYDKMLKKFILNHAPIWEALFILLNYKDIYKPEFNFLEYLKIQMNGIPRVEQIA
jgi:hypothetical protein